MTYSEETRGFTVVRSQPRGMDYRLKVAFFCFAICLSIIALWSFAYSQDIKIYEKTMGESATFAWDHTSAGFLCTVDQKTISFPYGTGGTWTCNGKTYQVTWSGDTIKVADWWPEGPVKDYTATYKYNYAGYKQPVFTGISLAATGVGSFPFTITTAGKYIAYGYVALDGDAGGCDSFFTSMDGAAQTVWDTPNDATKVGTFVWDRINVRGADPAVPGVPIVYTLAAGQHTLAIADREPCTKINGIVIVPEGSPPPAGAESKIIEGSVVPNQVAIPLTFGAGDLRMEVQTSREEVIKPDGTKETELSAFSKSTDPAVATVDGVARGWLVRIKDQSVPCTSFTYSAWTPDPCPANGQQTRTVLSALPAGCVGGNPILTQTCTPPVCTSFTYTAWEPANCPANGQQTRTVASALPAGCAGGSPVLTQTCIPTPPPPGAIKGLRLLP